MDRLDFEELMMYLTGGDCDEPSDKFEEKYNINSDLAYALIKDLLPLCETGQSPLTKKYYRGFSSGEFWLIKKEVAVKRDGS